MSVLTFKGLHYREFPYYGGPLLELLKECTSLLTLELKAKAPDYGSLSSWEIERDPYQPGGTNYWSFGNPGDDMEKAKAYHYYKRNRCGRTIASNNSTSLGDIIVLLASTEIQELEHWKKYPVIKSPFHPPIPQPTSMPFDAITLTFEMLLDTVPIWIKCVLSG
jgi:hypothetical protein